MTLRKDFDPHLATGEVTVTDRDIEMLRAIDQFGSMHRAADELGRSYPHLQRRVVALEEAIGQLTQRKRGGSKGGGTRLTPEARDLIQQFKRLRVGLTGVTTVPESIITGTVQDQDGELARVRTAAGEITARVPREAEKVEIAIRADAVVLMQPHSPPHSHTSLRNQLAGVVSDLTDGDATATVTVEIAENVVLTSIVTEESVDRLDLAAGTDVIAAFKTTAARGTPVDV